jgi:glutathione S-transferase
VKTKFNQLTVNDPGATGQANHFVLFAPVKSEYGQKRYLDETKRLFDVLEIRLKESPYLAGDKYTIADICSVGWVRSGEKGLKIDLNAWPAMKKWLDKIVARPAVQKGLKLPEPKFDEQQLAELFENMRAKMDARENTDKH